MMSTRIVLLAAILSAAPCAAADTPYPPLPKGLSSFGAAVSDGYVYVYGGHIGTAHTYSTESVTGKFRRLDLANPAKGWEELAEGTPLQGLALVAHGGRLYRVGGMQPMNKPGEKSDNRSTASVAVYTPKTNRWEPMPDMPAGRSSHDAAVAGDLLVVVGGWTMPGGSADSVWHDTTLTLDLSQPNAVWKSVAQPFKRRALGVAAIGDQVFAIGGMTWENEVDKAVDILDVKKSTWSPGLALPGGTMNGFSPAACAVGGLLCVSPMDGNVYELDARKAAWSTVGKLDAKRLVHRIVPISEGRILALAGGVEGRKPCEPRGRDAEDSAAAGRAAAKGSNSEFCPVMTGSPVRCGQSGRRIRGRQDPGLLRDLSQALEGGAGRVSRSDVVAAAEGHEVAGPAAGADAVPGLSRSGRVVEGSVDGLPRSDGPFLQRNRQEPFPGRPGEIRRSRSVAATSACRNGHARSLGKSRGEPRSDAARRLNNRCHRSMHVARILRESFASGSGEANMRDCKRLRESDNLTMKTE